jgi:hypothetical protein
LVKELWFEDTNKRKKDHGIGGVQGNASTLKGKYIHDRIGGLNKSRKEAKSKQ